MVPGAEGAKVRTEVRRGKEEALRAALTLVVAGAVRSGESKASGVRWIKNARGLRYGVSSEAPLTGKKLWEDRCIISVGDGQLPHRRRKEFRCR